MLEIASQIVICLLIAALIGFIIGYLVCKSLSKKTNSVPTEEVTEKEEPLVVEKNEIEEMQIPTENIVSDAVKALEEVDSQEIEELGSQKPELLDSPRNNKKDTLSKIKGIGPKVEKQLNEAGIYHFEQIANWLDANRNWRACSQPSSRPSIKDLWVAQAKSLS